MDVIPELLRFFLLPVRDILFEIKKNCPYYKGAILWDGLSVVVRNSNSLLEFKKHLITVYRAFDNHIT